MTVQKNSSRSFQLPATQMVAFAANALTAINANILQQTATSLTAKTGTSLRSFGENIEIKITPVGENACQVSILSQSTMKTTVVDWGKNQKNIKRLIAGIENC